MTASSFTYCFDVNCKTMVNSYAVPYKINEQKQTMKTNKRKKKIFGQVVDLQLILKQILVVFLSPEIQSSQMQLNAALAPNKIKVIDVKKNTNHKSIFLSPCSVKVVQPNRS